LGALFITAPAFGAAPIDVDARDCARLNREALETMTRLELKSEAETPLTVRYGCEGSELTIAIESSAAGTRIVRRVIGGWENDVEPERTVALLALGLFRAAHALLRAPDASQPLTELPSASELASKGVHVEALPQPAPVPSAPSAIVAPPPAPIAPQPKVQPVAPQPRAFVPPPLGPPPAAPDMKKEEERASDRLHDIGAGIGVRAHNTAALLPMMALIARYRHWPIRALGVGPMFSAELGSTDRVGGSVSARIFQIGATGAIRMFEKSVFQLLFELEGTASIVQLAGDATVAGFTPGDTLTGGTGNVGAFLVPALGVNGISVGVPIGAGYLFRAPRGRVDEDETVQVDGVWLSAGVAVQFGWGKRKEAPNVARRP
jgi:hypothetical protein